MSDKRFEDRLKRIEARNQGGARAELLAGVGEVSTARAGATAGPAVRSASLLLILLGASTGFMSFGIVRDLAEFRALSALPPEQLVTFFLSEPLVGAAAAALALCGVLSVTSFLRGRSAVRMMSFSGAALGAAIGSAIPVLA